MIPALARFSDTLRKEGLRASPAELLDATRALDAIGMENRARFRAALRMTLAKTRRDRDTFDRAFDRFFAPPARAPRKKKDRAAAGDSGNGTARHAGDDATRPGRRPPERERRRARERERGRGMPDDAKRRLQEVLGPKTARHGGRPRSLILSRAPGRDGLDGTTHASADPRRVPITRRLSADDERALAREVARVVSEIRLRSGRRFGRARGGRPWPQRMFRVNVGHDSVPFVLPYRTRRPKAARVVVLVDVSHSTATAAGYFLWMALEFLKPGRKTTVLAFVDRPVHVTRALEQWMRGATPVRPASRHRRPGEGIRPSEASFADLLDSVPALDLNAPSDYGRMFWDLLRAGPRMAASDTILVVLGDGRTNRFEPLPWAFEEIARRCRSVLWLVPEPVSRWGTGDSALGVYLRHADVVVESNDLEGLARGTSELVRRL